MQVAARAAALVRSWSAAKRAQADRIVGAHDPGRRCPRCGTPTEHVCAWVCVEMCHKCDYK